MCLVSLFLLYVLSAYLHGFWTKTETKSYSSVPSQLILKEKNPKTMYLKKPQYKTEKQPKLPPNHISSAQMSEWSFFLYQGKLKGSGMVSLKIILSKSRQQYCQVLSRKTENKGICELFRSFSMFMQLSFCVGFC